MTRKNLVIIEEFLSNDAATFLNNHFRSIDPDVRDFIGFHWGDTDENLLNLSQPVIREIMQKATLDIKSLMEKNFNLKLKLKRCLVQSIYTGGEVGYHWDDHYAEKEDGVAQNIYSAILYLSSNYEGGEINFSKVEIELKPDPGTLVFFPGIEHFEHAVNEVISGERTNFILFFNLAEEGVE
jgi:hypothetical protein